MRLPVKNGPGVFISEQTTTTTITRQLFVNNTHSVFIRLTTREMINMTANSMCDYVEVILSIETMYKFKHGGILVLFEHIACGDDFCHFVICLPHG